MKITTEITDRDKKLLLFLAIFVIVVVFGFFIIRPLAETDAALKEELAVQEELQIRTQQKLMLLPSMQANVEKTEEELAAVAEDFYPVMKSQEIDKLLTGIVLSWGLESRQLVIQMPEGEMILDPFYASQAALEEMLSQAIGAGLGGTDGYCPENLHLFLWDLCGAGDAYHKGRAQCAGADGG